MKKYRRQLLAAFLMGVLLPALAMRIGSLFVTAQQQPEAAMPSSSASSGPGALQELPAATIPVLLTPSCLSVMELEGYVCGVVLAEMPVDFSAEALKAQAVAARTCALYCTEKGVKHIAGAVCTDPGCCQAYMPAQQYLAQGGRQEDVDKVLAAVRETAGQVLTYQGALIDATYFSCSGGMTEDAVAVWGSDVPYLQSVQSPGEEWAQVYSQQVVYSPEEFQRLLGRRLAGSPEQWLGKVERTRGGGVALAVVAGISYTGTQLRRLLALNSTAFTMSVQDGQICIQVTGRGHRVGMSQYGAEAMARQGYTHEEILTYYYQGTRIDKPGAVG